MSIEFSDRTLPTMRGGPLSKDVFQFMNVEFRWGPENSSGAEHSINGIWLETISLTLGARRVSRRCYSAHVSSHSIDRRYSMEAQITHWNTRYGSIEKCFDKPDGIAVLSYLMQVRILVIIDPIDLLTLYTCTLQTIENRWLAALEFPIILR